MSDAYALKAAHGLPKYKVAFDSNATSGQPATGGPMANQDFVYGTAQNLTKNAFQRDGYAFTSWNTKPDGSGDRYEDEESVKNLTTKNGATVTLYAQWSAKDSKLIYKANGGSGNTASTEGKTDQVVQVAESGFSRTGYTFTGWNTEADGSGAAYEPGGSFTLQATDTTLYAQWTPNTYTIAFDSNGGAGSMSPVGAAYDESKNLPGNGFGRPGYTFTGWNTKADGSGTGYADKASVKNLTTKNGATVTLYAQWTPNDSKLTYNANGGKGTTADTKGKTDQTVKVGKNGFKHKGHTFTGWNTKADGSGKAYKPGDEFKLGAKPSVLYAQWKVDQHTITFDSNGGNKVKPITQDYGTKVKTPDDPTREGYTFEGWEPEVPSTMPDKDMTLKAKWKIKKYDVTFDSTGGTDVDPQTVEHGGTATEPADPTRDGYTFAGWVDEDGRPYDFSTPVTGDTIVYATWNANLVPAPTPGPTPTPTPAPIPTPEPAPIPNPAPAPVPSPADDDQRDDTNSPSTTDGKKDSKKGGKKKTGNTDSSKNMGKTPSQATPQAPQTTQMVGGVSGSGGEGGGAGTDVTVDDITDERDTGFVFGDANPLALLLADA